MAGKDSRRESTNTSSAEVPEAIKLLTGSFVFPDGTRYEGSYTTINPDADSASPSPAPDSKKPHSAPPVEPVESAQKLIRSGFGKNTSNGFVYEGQFDNDMMDGAGKLSCPNGVSYEVNFFF
jgi:hypothetical protein